MAARYYNKTRTSVPITLRSGKTAFVPGKTWLTVDTADDNSPSLVFHVSKGHLVRQAISEEAQIPVVSPVPAQDPPIQEPKPEKKEAAPEESSPPKEQASGPSPSDTPKGKGPFKNIGKGRSIEASTQGEKRVGSPGSQEDHQDHLPPDGRSEG